ncbi:PREDICTED: disintegrin and metalloproteinase domain-containing protein 8-like [Dipodomys ordii]|uniref:Disintegrin and metalloproteinase domain-containing protein 8-like n=1 Tax=Dipodomys ordii TaxID=10020 RepID=A0A1S3GQJ3_DIPOR|nr:PREDICTED: disintegrin and metalloproteinase domain-containing protein 8-like [Dipodomys ordii]
MSAKEHVRGPPGLASTCSRQPPKPTLVPKRPPPAPPAAMSSPAAAVPVYPQQTPDQLQLPPPAKPLPKLKPTQEGPEGRTEESGERETRQGGRLGRAGGQTVPEGSAQQSAQRPTSTPAGDNLAH